MRRVRRALARSRSGWHAASLSCCINTHALVSGLARRVLHDGVVPPSSDFEALLRLGVAPADVLRALEGESPAAIAARARLAELVARREG